MKKESKNSKQKSVKAIPDGFHSVTPFLIAEEADRLIEFIKEAFDGEVTDEMKMNDDKIMHATVKIGDSLVMIAESMEKMPANTAMLYLYVEDVDAVYKQALDADATSIREPKDEFYGDRSAGVQDEWGNQWWIATHTEDVSREELERRQEEYSKQTVG